MFAAFIAVASWFLPGLGPGLVGRYKAMAIWMAASTLATLALAVSPWLVVAVVVVRLAALVDGFRWTRIAVRAGARLHGAGVAIAVGGSIALWIAIRLFALDIYLIPSSSMTPTVTVGDHLLIDKLSKLWHQPAHGDVIVFRHPCTPERDYVKRVIAVAGETVEIRCNVVYVSGTPLHSEMFRGERCTYDDFFEEDNRWTVRSCSEYLEMSGGRTYRVFHDPGRPERDARPNRIKVPDEKDFPRLDSNPEPPSCRDPFQNNRAAPDQLPGSVVGNKTDAGVCEQQLHYVVPPGHVFVLGDNRPNSNDSRYWGSVPIGNIKGRVVAIWLAFGKSGFDWHRLGTVE